MPPFLFGRDTAQVWRRLVSRPTSALARITDSKRIMRDVRCVPNFGSEHTQLFYHLSAWASTFVFSLATHSSPWAL